jgi:hypothetical protein
MEEGRMSEEREARLARLVLEIEACKSERKAQAKGYQDRIDELEEQRDKLARDIRDGQATLFSPTETIADIEAAAKRMIAATTETPAPTFTATLSAAPEPEAHELQVGDLDDTPIDQVAFNAGGAARDAGLDRKANTYGIGSPEWTDWNLGWQAADEEAAGYGDS